MGKLFWALLAFAGLIGQNRWLRPSPLRRKLKKPNPKKPKAVKHPEAIAELIAEPVRIDAKVTDEEVDSEKKIAMPKAAKKATPKPAESHDKPVE